MPENPSPLTFLKKIPFTLSVILINIGVFTFSVLKAGTLTGPQWAITLLRLGAQFNPLVLDREWYRIFTHIFLHGSILHLAANMVVLAYLGTMMEGKVGIKKFAFVYFVSAIASAFCGLYWNLFTIGIGTPGAISGLLGFSLVYNIFFPGKSGKATVILLIVFGIFVSLNLLIPEMGLHRLRGPVWRSNHGNRHRIFFLRFRTPRNHWKSQD